MKTSGQREGGSRVYLLLQGRHGGLELGGAVGLPVPLVLQAQFLHAILQLLHLRIKSHYRHAR